MKRDQKIQQGIAAAIILSPVAIALASACSAGGGNSGAPGGLGANGQGGYAGGSMGGDGNFGTSGDSGSGPIFGSGGANSAGGGGPVATGGFVANMAKAPLPPQTDLCMAQAAQFQGGSGSGITYTYPYDGTVFPRGLLAPQIMWNQSGNADQVMLKMQSQKFSYQKCFAATNPLRISVPQDAWDSAGFYSNGPSDPMTISISVVSGGQKLGPVTETVMFAQASIKGAIYYNTYNSPLAQNNGAVLKIIPGQAQPTAFLVTTATVVPPFGPCISCHALSANGSVMTANEHNYTPFASTFISRSYDVTAQSPTVVANNIQIGRAHV